MQKAPGLTAITTSLTGSWSTVDTEPDPEPARAAVAALAAEDPVDAPVIQTVGSEDHDGCALVVVRKPPCG